ncbi:MAG: hypothetical protein U5L11_00755 [Arhodomonas sp.]|nr:hypothetical protein [Arhodomonas sp.]
MTGNDLSIAPATDQAEPALAGLSMIADTNGFDNTVDAAFSVQNAQSGADSVTATLHDGAPAIGNAGTSLVVGSDVVGSTLEQDGNEFIASAYNNQAVNDLSLEANTVGATSGVQSFQVVNSADPILDGYAGHSAHPGYA